MNAVTQEGFKRKLIAILSADVEGWIIELL